ncbi:metallophosphoesterase family protein [[Eubacterium] cellulosolvens]
MPKFAHISDIHLGANTDPAIASLEIQAFDKTIDTCINERLDFILICGDIFHVSIPDLQIADHAVQKLKQLNDQNIPIYTIFGSHDFTPNGKSIIDLLQTADLIKNIAKGQFKEEKITLNFTTDPKTGAKLVGIFGRKGGLDKEYYQILDKENLEKEDGFKIFAFHACLDEFKPEYMLPAESIPISNMPKGFNYYAGGHVHERIQKNLIDYPNIIFPGTLFGSQPRDHEASGRGEKRGFYIIEFEDEIKEIKFIPINVCEFLYEEFNLDPMNPDEVEKYLANKFEALVVKDKIVMLKVSGELSSGKISDIDFSRLKRLLIDNGALKVNLNRHNLKSKEFATIKIAGEDPATIEKRLLQENLATITTSQTQLQKEQGLKLAINLLKTFRQEIKTGESKKDYTERMKGQGIQLLNLKDVFTK